MEWNEKELDIIEKADFYRTNKIIAHVLLIEKGKFKNGLFISGLEQSKFYWFKQMDSNESKRLFLSEIYDIKEYEEEEE